MNFMNFYHLTGKYFFLGVSVFSIYLNKRITHATDHQWFVKFLRFLNEIGFLHFQKQLFKELL